MKMPVLLSGHTMTPAGTLRPQSMQLNLRMDNLSSAVLVLDEDNPDVKIGDWVQIWAPNGEMCVMYAKNVRKDYVTKLNTVTMEHTFGLLDSMIVFGEVDAATMSGTTGATTCTVTQAIDYLLSQQTETLWTRYQVDFNDSQGWKFTNSDIYNDLNSLTDAIMNCQWEFDQSVFPWRLSLKAWPNTATMEMRRNRNIESLKITMDRSGMYTRVYPTGKNNLHISGNYLDQNTNVYGIIANVITDSSISSAGLLQAWATKQLAKNSSPKYTVTITGYDLSEATGESLDKLTIGRRCVVPLPEYNTTVNERLMELAWKDCIAQPEAVNVTLANELKTITGVLNEQARGGGGGSKKANTEHDCELEENEEKIEEFENSDIWINRDSVWAVTGCYTVTTWTDQYGTHKKLKVNDGTAMVLERSGAEFGVYDEGNLTGGIMVNKINGQSSVKISGDRVDINGSSITISADRIDINGIVQKLSSTSISCAGMTVSYQLTLWGHAVGESTTTIPVISVSDTYYFKDTSNVTRSGKFVTSLSSKSITYLHA